MVYMLLMTVVAIIISYGVIIRYQTRQLVLFSVIVTTYVAAMCFYLLYLCKDSLHLGVFLNYFPFPRYIVLKLYMLQIPKMMVLRCLNFLCISFLFSNILFAVSFLPVHFSNVGKFTSITASVLYLFQLLLFDPYLYQAYYTRLYPDYVSSIAIETFYRNIEKAVSAVNIALLIFCVIVVLMSIISLPHARIFRLHLSAVTISYALLIVSYLLFFYRLPASLVKYSKVAHIVTYRSLAASGGMAYYRYYPYIVLMLLILLGVSFFAFLYANRRSDLQNQEVLRNINTVNVSSRLFCHYMKNEILAISAEVEALAEETGKTEASDNILSRCDTIYYKLDGIHKNMRDNAMLIKRIPIDGPITKAVADLQNTKRLEGITVKVLLPEHVPSCMIDEIYFVQALYEIMLNACDAMHHSEIKELTIAVAQSINWVNVEITDTGCGISAENLTNIFTPLYTTKKLSQSWGIGLTMSHKTISSLKGRINVRSVVGSGTCFEILLPVVKPPKEKKKDRRKQS